MCDGIISHEKGALGFSSLVVAISEKLEIIEGSACEGTVHDQGRTPSSSYCILRHDRSMNIELIFLEGSIIGSYRVTNLGP